MGSELPSFDPAYPPGHPDHCVRAGDVEVALALAGFYDEQPKGAPVELVGVSAMIAEAADDPVIVELAQQVLASSFDNPALDTREAFAGRARNKLQAYGLEAKSEAVFRASLAGTARRERDRIEAINGARGQA